MFSKEFYGDNHWRTLYKEKDGLYEKRIDTRWPFPASRKICSIPSDVGFYDPIRIEGLNVCGIVVLSSQDPGLETDVTAYVPTGAGWAQAKFQMPDGTTLDQFRGYIRRKEVEKVTYTQETEAANMEVCQRGEDGRYVLYRVAWEDGVLTLTPQNDVELTEDEILCWTY